MHKRHPDSDDDIQSHCLFLHRPTTVQERHPKHVVIIILRDL